MSLDSESGGSLVHSLNETITISAECGRSEMADLKL
jgi:hypothetical protein